MALVYENAASLKKMPPHLGILLHNDCIYLARKCPLIYLPLSLNSYITNTFNVTRLMGALQVVAQDIVSDLMV